MTSSTASIYNASVPLATTLVAGLVFKTEHLTRLSWTTLALGTLGVVLVVAPCQSTGDASVLRQLEVLLAEVAVAFAYVYVYQSKYMAALKADSVLVAYLSPVVGVVLGSLVLGDSFTWNAAIGTALVFVAIALGRKQSA